MNIENFLDNIKTRSPAYILLPLAIAAAGSIYVDSANREIHEISERLGRYTQAKVYEKEADTFHKQFNEGLMGIDEKGDEIERMILQIPRLQEYSRSQENGNGSPVPNFPGWYYFNPMPRLNPQTAPPFRLLPPYNGGARVIPQKR